MELMKQGWTMQQIDDMDILFFFEVMRSDAEAPSQQAYIDQLIF